MNTLKIKNNPDSFSVYNNFVDRFLKDANPSFIKVYLYIARHSNGCGELSLDAVADGTGLLKSDVVTSLKYWDDVGAIKLKDNTLSILNPQEPGSAFAHPVEEPPALDNVSDAKPEKLLAPETSVASSYKASSVIKTVTTDEKLAHLFAIIAQLLNKSLSSNDYKVIYSFIDYLKLPEQVIIVLIEYCVSISKTNMRYIEKVAYSWADNGVITPELALEYVKKQNARTSIMAQYKKLFKIVGREFSEKEEKFIFTWVNEYKADEALIMKAYDTSVLNTGKVSFKYMDAVIQNELGHTAGNNGATKPLPSNIQKSTFRNISSDTSIGDIEKQMIQKMMSQFGGDSDAVNE